MFLFHLFFQGKVHERLGHTNKALKYFNMAISLDPKEGTAIKVNTNYCLL